MSQPLAQHLPAASSPARLLAAIVESCGSRAARLEISNQSAPPTAAGDPLNASALAAKKAGRFPGL